MRPIPLPWVEALFARMLVRYGSLWLMQWEGVPAEALAADWAAELAGLSDVALRYGVANLPLDKPPTLGQFKALCLRAPEAQQPLIDAPPANPERVARLLARARAALHERSHLQWAYDLQARESRGEDLTARQRADWRAALITAPTPELANFVGISPDCLPPAMRPEQGQQP